MPLLFPPLIYGNDSTIFPYHLILPWWVSKTRY